MIHTVYSIKDAKKFLEEHGYTAKLWSRYPDRWEILEEITGLSIEDIPPFVRGALLAKYKKQIEDIAERRWTLILIDANKAAERIESVLKYTYGLEDPVVKLEVYPHVVYGWRIKKKMKRSGKPVYFARRVEKIIDPWKGGVFIAVPREYKKDLVELVEFLRSQIARYYYPL